MMTVGLRSAVEVISPLLDSGWAAMVLVADSTSPVSHSLPYSTLVVRVPLVVKKLGLAALCASILNLEVQVGGNVLIHNDSQLWHVILSDRRRYVDLREQDVVQVVQKLVWTGTT
jgi:hypothetical protein